SSLLQAFAHHCDPLGRYATGRAMQYKGFDFSAFEQQPGKWRARVLRANGRPSNATSRKLQQLVSSAEPSSAVDVLILVMEAIDGLFFRNAARRKRRRRHRAHRLVGLQKGQTAESNSL